MERYSELLEQVKDIGYVMFVDKESSKLVEIEYYSIPKSFFEDSELIWKYQVVVNKEIVYQDSKLDIKTLYEIIQESSSSQNYIFRFVAEWLEKFAVCCNNNDLQNEFITLGVLLKKYSEKLDNVNIYQLSHLVNGINQTYELAEPEYFVEKVYEILVVLGVVNQLNRLERIKRNTIESVLNRALLGDNTKGV